MDTVEQLDITISRLAGALGRSEMDYESHAKSVEGILTELMANVAEALRMLGYGHLVTRAPRVTRPGTIGGTGYIFPPKPAKPPSRSEDLDKLYELARSGVLTPEMQTAVLTEIAKRQQEEQSFKHRMDRYFEKAKEDRLIGHRADTVIIDDVGPNRLDDVVKIAPSYPNTTLIKPDTRRRHGTHAEGAADRDQGVGAALAAGLEAPVLASGAGGGEEGVAPPGGGAGGDEEE